MLTVGRPTVFFLGSHGDRARRRTVEAERERDRRAALPGRRRAARRGLLDLLHGHQSRRVDGLGARADRRGRLRLGRWIRAAGGRNGARARPVPVDAALPRRGRRDARPAGRASWWPVAVFLAIVAGASRCSCSRAGCALDPVAISVGANWVMIALVAGYFAYLLLFAGLDRTERSRAWAMVALAVACAMFWAGYEQAGASFNLFAERYTELDVLGWQMPAGVLQAVNPTVHHPVCAGVRGALGESRPPHARAFGAGEVRARAALPGRGVPRDVPGGRVRRAGREGARRLGSC